MSKSETGTKKFSEVKDIRLHYYQFPDNTSEEVLLKEGCEVVLKSGGTISVDSIPDDKRHLVDRVNNCLYGLSITHVKQLLKQYGGHGWTEHCERDGSLFEVTDITLKGNNSRFKYNRHL